MTGSNIKIRALIIAAIYLVFGVAWILITDSQLFEIYSSRIIDFYTFQIYKGLFYIFITSVLVYFLAYFALKYQVSGVQSRLDNERHLQSLTAHSRVGLYDTDSNGQIVYCNDRLLEIMGLENSTNIDQDRINALHEEDREYITGKWKTIIETETAFHDEYRYQHANGQVVWVIEDGQPCYDESNRLCGYIGVVTDITDRKQAESALAKSESRFRKLVEFMPFAVLTVDDKGIIQYVNRNIEKLFGYRSEELVGRTIECLIPDRLRNAHIHERMHFMQKPSARGIGAARELVGRHKDGREIPMEISLVPLEYAGTLRILTVINDISQRREAENRSTMLAKRNQKLVTALGEIVYEHDIANNHIEWQGNITGVLGYTGEEMGDTEEAWLNLIHPDDRADVLSRLEEPADQGFFEAEYRILNKMGNYIWFWDRGVMEYDDQGNLLNITGVMRDVTSRKEAEYALRESQIRLEHVLSANPTVLYVLHISNGNIVPVWASSNITRIFGYAMEEILQPDWWEKHIHPDDHDRCLEDMQNVLEKDSLEHEYRFMHRDGNYIWIRDELRVLRNNKGQATEILGSWNDISQRVDTESKLRQMQKLDAIGQLTSGIAHDFNNRLTVILGNLQFLEHKMENNDESKKLVHSAIEAAKAGATLTQRLLSFSKQQILETEIINVNNLVMDVSNLLENILEEIVTIELRLDNDLWLIKVDAGQLQEVIFNLCVNARDAMPDGGDLVIETSNVSFDDDTHRMAYRIRAGDYVKISISDTGCGMSSEILERIFEPFFTTKKKGKITGTGLGLAMVYGFVKQSMGYINVYSEPDHGTCVNIYLPRCTEKPGRTAEPAMNEKNNGSTQKLLYENPVVLVVEDDEFVRNISTMLLKELGCRVLEAENAAEGLHVLQKENNIDLVFSDMMMPGGMSGIDMINEMRKDEPGLKAIIVSGYSEDTVIKKEMNIHWLKKPFTRENLVKKLNEAFSKDIEL